MRSNEKTLAELSAVEKLGLENNQLKIDLRNLAQRVIDKNHENSDLIIHNNDLVNFIVKCIDSGAFASLSLLHEAQQLLKVKP
jgi:hypothetical protein